MTGGGSSAHKHFRKGLRGNKGFLLPSNGVDEVRPCSAALDAAPRFCDTTGLESHCLSWKGSKDRKVSDGVHHKASRWASG